ncbi:LIC_10190 family membrane protein [Aridibaculum aurantiacum]|uniref:LIC_10190 family membrane protein n=1 Tax=Aridibaculum aurantiacum TaxID=2810307 RepID=UPI001A96EFA3|nr:hypothetical protein [Aridibaculum aurantiacum]
MLLLLIAGSIFFFLAMSIGYVVNNALRQLQPYSTPLFEILLTGTATITIYLNFLSFFFPSGYLLLVPLAIAALIIVFTTPFLVDLKTKANKIAGVLFHKERMAVTIAVALVILIFAIVPPYNTDSSGYHILSILWNEKFKVVPGLANLFPQFGFNSAFMVLSAPFSFTAITGQSIYPINPVLVLAFFGWMLHKSYQYRGMSRLLFIPLLFILFRQFPINIASPSADALASMLVLYCFFTLLETKENWQGGEWKVLLLLAFFSVIIKISTIPLMLFVFLPFIFYRKAHKEIIKNYIPVAAIGLCIFLPWIARNIILSGYILFPFPSIDLVNVDWKVPLQVAEAERLHVSHAPRMVSEDWVYVNRLSFMQWFPTWLGKLWHSNKINALLTYATFATPVVAVVVFKRYPYKKWIASFAVAYLGILFWLIGSPDVRFGYHFMIPVIFFPLLLLLNNTHKTGGKISESIYTLAALGMCVYFSYVAARMLAPYTISQYAVKPLKSEEYHKNNDLGSFTFVPLSDSIKLYIHDRHHHSLNAPLPSTDVFRPGVRLRGTTLQDGFRNIQDTTIAK